jgi:acetyl-CoA/propionyl-CoA carboxylase biotin carboxyl carrier protein
VSDGALSTVATDVEVDGRRVSVKVLSPEPPYRALARRRSEREAAAAAAGSASGTVRSPMQGTVIDVKVAAGDEVAPGQVVCIVEAMKMENEIATHRGGVVADVSVAVGMAVSIGQPICAIDADGSGPT